MGPFTITLAYEDKPAPDIEKPSGHGARALLMRTGMSLLLPRFFGHTDVRLSVPGLPDLAVGFVPCQNPDGSFVSERRAESCYLEPLSSGFFKVPTLIDCLPAQLARRIPVYEGRIDKNPGHIFPDAMLSLDVSERTFRRVEAYIKEAEQKPLSLDPLRSNCSLFALNVALTVGFEVAAYAGKYNARVPDGLLAAFVGMAKKMGQNEKGRYEGILDGKQATLSFPSEKLVEAMKERLGLELPRPAFQQARAGASCTS